jgi:hypothetical protein
MALEAIQADGGVFVAALAELPGGIDRDRAALGVVLHVAVDATGKAVFLRAYAQVHGGVALV